MRSSPSISLHWRLLASILIVAMAVQPMAFANPAAPVIRSGAAEFNFDNPGQLLIQQGSDKLIVDWGEFSISAGELTQFIQPGSGSAALNRVTGALPSSIMGQLRANGRLLLINPNGVLIGAGGRIDTAGFIASTLDVSDADFLAGGDLRFQGDSLAKVVNLGTINAIDGGDIFLIAREVVNAGTLNAHEGTVGLAAGQQIVISAQGEERVAILPEGQEGSVSNSGTIAAMTAELKAAGGNEYALAVNNTGLVRAKGFENRGGRIYLSAGGGKGRISNTGTLKARMADNSGGLVQITHAGEEAGAGVDIGGRVDVKGDVGSGGMVLVTGPGIHVLPGARIDASGKVDGGQIALHSAGDEGTMIDGALVADGSSGDGGFIHVTGSFIGLGANGMISANGGNGGGFVLLGADPEDGSGQMQSSQIVLAPGSRISANGGSGDGGMVLINGARDGEVMLGGQISASSQAGVGGQVMAFGGNVSLGGTALIDAGGYRGGGQVYIGGGERGRDASKPNAQNTSVAEGALILANASAGGAGAGGRVVLWADRLMDFQGAIENRGAGGGAGGFTEVSGLEYLGFNGTVDTGGGNLLLDPYNYIIGATEAGNIVTALGLNNVTIDTTMDVAGFGSSGVNTDPGDITVNSAILYESTFDLTFLAMGDANFNASVQNRNDTGGDINIVAGWDGTTAYDTTVFVDADVSSTTVYGNGGSVNIGDGTQTAGIAVGSRSGNTNVFGYDVVLQGSNEAGIDGGFAQLGFQVTDGIALDGTDLNVGGVAPVVNGGIVVHALNDVRATGGSAGNYNYVQIGHVGADRNSNIVADAVADADIELSVGKDISFSGGGGNVAYAQLGNGGYRAVGGQSGATTITSAAVIGFTGVGNLAYAQLGNGGFEARGGQSGATTITSAAAIDFTGGGNRAYAQLGNGGYGAIGGQSGTTTITSAAAIDFTGGGPEAYAQLGNGGYRAGGGQSGATTITSAAAIDFTGVGPEAYAQLGNGGFEARGGQSGATTITSAAAIDFSGGGDKAYAQLGNGGYRADGGQSGATTITEAAAIDFEGGVGQRAYAQLGNGGYEAVGGQSGATTITSAAAIDFTGGAAFAYAQLGNGGIGAGGDKSGDINLTFTGDLMLTGQNTTSSYALIGNGDAPGDSDAGNSVSGNVTIDAGGNVTVNNGWLGNLLDADGVFNTGSMMLTADGNITLDTLLNQGGYNTEDAYSYIAGGDVNFNNSVQNRNDTGGDINIVAGWDGTTAYDTTVFVDADVSSTTVYGNGGSVNIGDGTQTAGIAVGSRSGNTNVFGYDVVLQGSNSGIGNFAQLGFQVTDGIAFDGTDLNVGGVAPAVNGGIVVHALNDVRATGGSAGNYNYVQIGHVGADQNGGITADAVADADIELSVGKDISYTGGIGFFAYAQLGNGGAFAIGGQSGATTITSAAAIDFTGGGGDGAYAQLGNGGYEARGGQSGATTITSAAAIGFTGGVGNVAYAQLGNGGAFAVGGQSGATTITSAATIDFTGGGPAAYAQLGNGGYSATGGQSGTTTITSAAAITFEGGGNGSYAQLGNGGYSATGGQSGTTTITEAAAITFLSARGGRIAYVQLGNGGYSATGGQSGTTTITEAAAITFTGGVDRSYAQLGNGGYLAIGGQSGATTITSAAAIDFMGGGFGAYAQLGNGGFEAEGGQSGATTITSAAAIDFSGGGGTGAYAQLGNGGYLAIGGQSGATTITSAAAIDFEGGIGFHAYAQLGNGGYLASGGQSGATTISSAAAINFSGGVGNLAYAQLGNGGYNASGDKSGDISVVNAGDLTLTAVGSGWTGIGHSGSSGNVEGDVMIQTGGNATLVGAFIGHSPGSGTYTSGNTFIGVVGDLSADVDSEFNSAPNNGSGDGELRFYVGGSDNVNLATQLNGAVHGGASFPNDQGDFVFGTGTYTLPGSLNPTPGNFNYYRIEQGIYNYAVDTLAEASAIQTDLNNGTDVTLAYNLNQANFGAEYDWDGGTQFIRFDSDLFYDSTNTLNLLATGDVNFNASVQNSNDTGGDINIVAGWDGTTAYDTTAFVAEGVTVTVAFGQNNGTVYIGNGGQALGVAVGSRSGDSNVFAYDVNLQGGNGAGVNGRFAQLGFQVSDQGAAYIVDGGITVHVINDVIAMGGDMDFLNYAQIGHVGADQSPDATIEATATSAIELSVGNDVRFTGGSGTAANAQLGQGGYFAFGDHSGTTMITRANDVLFSGGLGDGAYALLGQGGFDSDGELSGNTTIAQANDIRFEGGGGSGAYAQLGQGGSSSDGDHSGTTTINLANDVNFLGGGGSSAYAQLGQGGFNANGSHSGNTTIAQANDIRFVGGGGLYSYAQLGQGGAFSDGSHSGNTTITLANDVSFLGGVGNNANAQLGQGGVLADGDHSGTTTIVQVNDINFSGGAGVESYAQLGQGGVVATGSHSGNTVITQANNVNFSGGSGADAYAQLGQGGVASDGDHSGNATIAQANDVSITGGGGNRAYAQFGQGGWGSVGNHSGDISITHTGNLQLAGVNTVGQYALIGHGDEPGDGDAGNTVSGDVMVRTGGNTTLTNGFIGHLIDLDGSYTSGNTFVGVGSIAGPELLTADANSGLFSAPTGQLRFYIPGPLSNQIAVGASLNGTAAPGPGITPNAQGLYNFGLGPYNLVDPGNFAFYTLGVTPVVAAAAGGNNLPGDVLMPTPGTPGIELPASLFRQDIHFVRPAAFERASWMQWYDYGIEGAVEFLPNTSMYTLGSFEVDAEEWDE